MKILFFGTPPFAADLLRFLLDQGIKVTAIVTQPDRPKGRSLQFLPSPVKEIALERKIFLLQPEKASQESSLQELSAIQADLFVVVAYGQILSQKLLDIPRLGCINVHASLLPKYRGAAPIQRCLMAGEKKSGIAIQKMVKQLDAGDVIAVSEISIPLTMTAGELEKELITLAKPLLLQVLRDFERGIPPATPQDPNQVTYASKIELAEGQIHWNCPALEIHNLIRAFSPRPGAWTWLESGGEKKRLKILRSFPVEGHGVPGTLLSSEGIIACGAGALQLLEVQPEGKKVMAAGDWLRGQKNFSFPLH